MRKQYDFSRGRRGAVVSEAAAGKDRVVLKLDRLVLEWFKREVDAAGGGNYQSLINAALIDHISQKRNPLETTLRRVLREELRRFRSGAPVQRRRRY